MFLGSYLYLPLSPHAVRCSETSSVTFVACMDPYPCRVPPATHARFVGSATPADASIASIDTSHVQTSWGLHTSRTASRNSGPVISGGCARAVTGHEPRNSGPAIGKISMTTR